MVDLCRMFLSEIESADNPKETISDLQHLVCEVLDDGPPWVAMSIGAAFLGALSLYENPKGLVLISDFSEVTESMDYVFQDCCQEMEVAWQKWRKEVDENETARMAHDDAAPVIEGGD